MSVILKDSDDNIILTFPSGIDVVEEPFAKRLDTENRAYQHGSIIVSDGKIETRFIFLHGIFGETSQANMETTLNNIKKAIYTENLRLYSTQYSDYFYNVEVLNFESTFQGRIRVVEINIEFVCIDPFRYAKNPVTTDNNTVDESPEVFTVSNGGDIEVFPVITWTAGASANFSKVRIANAEDAAKYFEYEPASNITTSDVIEFDCQEGTVELAGSDDIANFTGSFIKLASGTNNITVTIIGTPGTNVASFVFRNKYL